MIRVLIVDDFKPWHRFISAVLDLDDRFKIVGYASDGISAIAQCTSLQPDIVMLDIGMPGSNGISVARQIRQILPETQVIFFTQSISSDYVRSAIELGARGFLAKADANEMLSAINTVAGGRRYFSKSVLLALPTDQQFGHE